MNKTRLPSRICSAALVTASLIGVSACTGPVHFASMIPVPKRWLAAKGRPHPGVDNAALARWWERFRDPQLNQLIASALTSSPDMRTALSRIEESRARRGVARSNLFPSIDASSSARGSRIDNSTRGSSNTKDFDAGLNMSWEIDLSGRLRQNVRAANADLWQSMENYHAAQVSLAAEVATTYVNLRATEAQLNVVQRTLETRGATLEIARWREAAGESSALETQQTITTIEEARAALPSLQQSIEQSRNQLALLAGKTPGSVNHLLGKSRRVPQPPALPALGIPADTLRQRPDVRAAEHAVEAAAARTNAAAAERYPTLALNGSLGIESIRASNLFSPETTAASLLGSLSAPIFNAGRIRQNIKIQSEQEKQALIAYESAVLRSLSEVENALIAIRRTKERMDLLQKAVASAAEAARLAQQRYEAGEADLLVVLDAQRTLLNLQQQQTNNSADRTTAHIQLYKALGGGWSARS
jgi:NodT family efflux transporter outer membrane factor (OMF) lipoprotein